MRLANLIGTLALAAGFSATARSQAQFTNLEAAIAAAQKDGKDIIVDFTGSDWCTWCIRLKREVFDTDAWAEGARSRYVFVEIDFPSKKKLPATAQRYNDALKDRFQVTGYPTIYVLDSSGRPYAKTGYERGGAKAYLHHLDGLASRKDEIADLLLKCNADDKVEKLGAIEKLLAKYEKWDIAHLQVDLLEQAVDLGSKRRGQYSADLATHFSKTGNDEKYERYLEICRKATPDTAVAIEVQHDLERKVLPLIRKEDWSAALEEVAPILKKAGKSPGSQQAYYLAGFLAYRQRDITKSIGYLETGAATGTTTPLGKKMLALARQLRANANPGK